MLATTLSTKFIPSTNLKGQVVGANWSFLLPDLELERVICIGMPSLSTLRTLSGLSQDIFITFTQRHQIKVVSSANLTNIHILSFDEASRQLSDGSTDLALLTKWSLVHRFINDAALQMELRRILKPEGNLYFEYHGMVDQRYKAQAKNILGAAPSSSHTFWLTPMTGENYTAVLADDRLTTNYFLENGLEHASIHIRGFSSLEQIANRWLATCGFTRRYAVLVPNEASKVNTSPPQYLQTIAAEAGINLDQYRWGLAAGGGYSTRKLLIFLFKREKASPNYIVKIVRNPALNFRIENEREALCQLQELGMGDSQRLPQVSFFGYHQNLAILGETMVEGVPLRQRTHGTAGCPYGRSAIDWLIDLSAASVDSRTATPAEAAEVLTKLFNQFTRIYHLPPEQNRFLESQIATLGHHQAPFPLVFQHGDPGLWNIIVNCNSQAVFLDWEAAEPKGMPLWDLFYFLRSYVVWAARCNGIRDSLKGFNQLIMKETELNRFWKEITSRYCQQIGVHDELVEPLFYTCWMHRALKEATRLTPSKLESGVYITLLRHCIAQHPLRVFSRSSSSVTVFGTGDSVLSPDRQNSTEGVLRRSAAKDTNR